MPPSLPAALSLLLLVAHPTAQSDSPFVAWARGHLAPLNSPARAFKALDSGIARAQLIGVGESVHEVQPFLEFRFQLLRHLVRNHGVTALVLESGLPEAMALDDYVGGRTASVDFDIALPGGFGSLAEIRRTMEWLREWNAGQGRGRPVSVYGADLPGSAGSMVPALDRLEDIVGGHADSRRLIGAIRPVAERASGPWWGAAAEKYDALPADLKAGLTSDVRLLAQAVGQSPGVDAGRREWARRLARVLEQHEAMLRLGAFSPTVPRDEALAENTLWVLGRLARGDRAVFWAHNAHIQRVPAQGPALPVASAELSGLRLSRALGERYYAIATAYGGPSMEDATRAAGDSVDGTLELVSNQPFLLPLRAQSTPAAVDSWLAQPRLMRFQTGYLSLPLAAAFDAVAYFDRASPAARISPARTP